MIFLGYFIEKNLRNLFTYTLHWNKSLFQTRDLRVKDIHNFVIQSTSADGYASSGDRTSAGTVTTKFISLIDIDRLVQERRNSSALAMELCLSCINPSIWEQHFSWIQYKYNTHDTNYSLQ